MQIGNINIGSGVVLAPMAGYSDIGMRYLALKYGADLAYTEMVSAKGLQYNSTKTKELLATSTTEKPCAVQLFGSDIDAYLAVIDKGYIDKFDIIDINMGCPVRKIVGNGEGSALMNNPKQACEIVKACMRSGKLVTVKIRSGFDTVNAPLFALKLQEAGASAITIHARLREQFYHGKADWNIIKQVVDILDIPVIGNGDISVYSDIAKMQEQTGCAGVMIGRAALGNPYIFTNACHNELYNDIKTHINMLLELYNERVVGNLFKKQLCYYAKHIDNSKKLRLEIHSTNSITDIMSVVDRYFAL